MIEVNAFEDKTMESLQHKKSPFHLSGLFSVQRTQHQYHNSLKLDNSSVKAW